MIAQIVRLRQVVQRWKTKSLRTALYYNSSSTPSGSLSVYVGLGRTRFVIPTRFLNLPVFVALLQQAEEEFGFQTSGGLALPCEPDFFSEILRFLRNDEQKFRRMGLDEFLNVISEAGFESVNDMSYCKESYSHAFTPLLHKTRVWSSDWENNI
ncbi:indole-3-acetic acid-induced protein arg7 [Phtheirospermum japonicum]|uniref:Indole-3-acetic acid-induced protein arg7 n=1 Tax=Phtheirospermum japonicum TaxID=374723 RepID=A0A830CU31_9LAMI|nr:indole-3-acetic acid-induced protein arg7 [Phtheirospermum japonicum]